MVESIKELKKICQPSGIGPVKMFYLFNARKVSIYFTKLFLNTSISANQITLLNLIIGLSANFLLYRGGYWHSIIGALILHLFIIFDCVDGEVARYRNSSSIRGKYFEGVVHYIVNSLIFVSVSFNINRDFNNIIIFIFGFSASLSLLLIQTAHLRARTCLFGVEIHTKSQVKKSTTVIGIVRKITSIIPAGLFIINMILVATVTNLIYLFLFFFGLLLPFVLFIKIIDEFWFITNVIDRRK